MRRLFLGNTTLPRGRLRGLGTAHTAIPILVSQSKRISGHQIVSIEKEQRKFLERAIIPAYLICTTTVWKACLGIAMQRKHC